MSSNTETVWRRQQKHPRGAVHLPVRISTIDAETDAETGESFFLSTDEQCQNLSRGGLFVATDEAVPTGSRLLVELELPGGLAIEAIGRVAWSRSPLAEAAQEGDPPQPGLGIEFLDGSSRDLTAVERYVARVNRRARRSGASPTPSAPATV